MTCKAMKKIENDGLDAGIGMNFLKQACKMDSMARILLGNWFFKLAYQTL